MATEEQKKARMIRLFNTIIAGMARGLYDLFGEAAIGVISPLGEEILEEMEHELGLEIHGEDPENILIEIERLLIDEYGLMKDCKIKLDPEKHEIDLFIQDSVLWPAVEELVDAGLPPLSCVEMMIAEAALRKRLGRKAQFKGVELDRENRIIDIDFHMFDED
jgi:hypothetical protein